MRGHLPAATTQTTIKRLLPQISGFRQFRSQIKDLQLPRANWYWPFKVHAKVAMGNLAVPMGENRLVLIFRVPESKFSDELTPISQRLAGK